MEKETLNKDMKLSEHFSQHFYARGVNKDTVCNQGWKYPKSGSHR